MINIYQQPASITFAQGSRFTFSIGANTDIDDGYVTYRWEWTAPGTSNWAAIQHPSATLMSVIVIPSMANVYGTNDFRCVLTEYNALGAKKTEMISAIAKGIKFDGRTNVAKTKTSDAVLIRSRLSRHSEFEMHPSLDNTFLSDNIGLATLQDSEDNITHPNVQSAIVDLADGMTMPIGAVIIERKNNDPSGKAQQTVLQFDGIVASPVGGTDAIISAFGRRIKIADKSIAAQVKDQVLTILADYENAGLYVKNVISASATSISFEHRDHKSHVPPAWTQCGITMTGLVASPASKGYGQWQKFAETNITGLDAAVSKLYYWERIS
ncbi:baseplate wedge subunit and tail pin [Aeromonas phage AsFcp_2]|nr:baseplate wedge subunit and tail pin [Aeromonas phage AsFcp_2]